MSSTSQSTGSLAAADDPSTSVPASSSAAGKLTRVEGVIIAVAIIVLALLRWGSVGSHRWNSDETQHLHVVWAWTVGKLQYRDIFDNHTPLFHILNAPLLYWLGERADIVLLMRQAMIPLFAGAIWAIYRLGATLYDRRTGWLAALLAALFPMFFFCMGEFRTDVMWATVWLLALVVALTGKLTPGRTFGAALLLGAAFSISMKTTLLVLCLAVAGIITWWVAGRPIAKNLPAQILAALAGLVVIPGAIILYFASQGALGSFYHCVIEHNTMPGQHLGQLILRHVTTQSTLWIIPVWICAARMLPKVRQDPHRGYRRLFLFLIAGLYYSLLRALWPIVTAQDYLPWLPLVPIFVVVAVTWLRSLLPGTRLRTPLPWVLVPTLLLIAEIVSIVISEPPFKFVEEGHIRSLAAVLRLTKPDEYVFDLKGETVYRARPTYLVFETLTIQQIQQGKIKDDSIEQIIAKRTAVVRPSERMMPETRHFLGEHYIKVDGARVLGHGLPARLHEPLKFEITVPERYTIINPTGPASGTLDGTPLDGPRWLDAGPHELTLDRLAGPTAFIWARAVELGFSPFPKSGEPTAPE